MKEVKEKNPQLRASGPNTPRSNNNPKLARRGTSMNIAAAIKSGSAGFTYNDFSIMKILGNFLLMSVEYFIFKILQKQKHEKKA